MRSFRLPSGRRLSVRPIRHDDDARLVRAFALMSPQTRYQRFLTVKTKLTAKDTHFLVDVDGYDHVALVATPCDEPERIVAVARFVRLENDPAAAEFAIAIGDAYQREGLGMLLMGELMQAAAERGIERFVGTILAENEGAHRLVARVAAGAPRWQHHGSVDEVEFELAAPVRLAA
jgi:acetyltransferase